MVKFLSPSHPTRKKNIKKQPGIITVITESDIKRTGAKTLLDVLKNVPGFHIDIDTNQLYGIAVRGISGSAGKVLLLIDEIPQNSGTGGYIYLGNHYAADQIKRIEIIRGPGSAKYGGTAELSVINVITHGAEQNANTVSTSLNFNDKRINSHQYLYQSGKEFETWNYSFAANKGYGSTSEDTYTGLNGLTDDTSDSSKHEPSNIKLYISNDNFRNIFNYDKLYIEDRIFFGEFGASVSNNGNPFQDNYSVEAERFHNRISYHKDINDKLKIQTSLLYSHHTLNYDLPESGQVDSIFKNDIWDANLETLYHIDKTSFLAGLNYRIDKESIKSSSIFNTATYYNNGSDNVTHFNKSIYAQLESETPFGDITLGARYEKHDYVGEQFVPRIALNKIWDKWHTKLMYNEAFRIAQPTTIATAERVGRPIKAETTKDIEAELGYKISPHTQILGNIFWLEVENFIAYDPVLYASVNSGTINTWGGELIIMSQHDWGQINATYSYYRLKDTNIDVLKVDQTNNTSLGLPNHKFTLDATYYVSPITSINLNGNIQGARYGCTSDPAISCGNTKKVKPQADFDLYLNHQRDNLNLGIGIDNILNTSITHIQPYKGGLAPVPDLGRSIVAKLSYKF